MKTSKISKILGIGLTIAMLTSLLTVAVPASAGTLAWGAELGMPAAPTTTAVNILAAGSDVNDIAVSSDGGTIYAVSSGPTGNYTLKSTNGGTSWSRLTVAGLMTPRLVTTAPGDANTVMVVGDNISAAANHIYYSTNGGSTFDELTGHTMTTINDIAISPLTAGVRYVTLAGIAGVVSDIQYLNVGSLVSTWTSIATDAAWQGADPIAGDTDVRAIAYSPNFASDKVLTAVSNNSTPANALFEIISFSSKKSNINAGFAGYPVSVLSVAPTGAAISLAPTYLGADETLRTAFVALSPSTASQGLARLDNTTVKVLKAAVAFSSVNFNGTDLVAGAGADNNVYYSANPTATTPTVSNTSVYQRPGGVSATLVQAAFAGANVVAGTSGVGTSAFSVSKDKGATFNDVSLIDTALTTMPDVAVAKDATTVYLVSNDGANTSVWRKTTAWERVLNLAGAAAYIVRAAPESAASVYLANTASTDMYYSSDSGEKAWLLRALTNIPIDVAVESAQVLYALNGATVSKSSNAGFTWDTAIATGLGNGATITSVKANQLVVGGTAGGVAWSTDGNAAATTWQTTSTQPQTSGNMYVAADKLETGGFIYSASSSADKAVKRLSFGSTTWSTIQSGTIAGTASGLALSDGVVYVVSFATDNTTRLTRTLIPTTATSSTVWSSVSTSVPAAPGTPTTTLNKAPSALKASLGKLWAINTVAPNVLNSFTDTTYKTAPAVALPADLAVPATNPVSGRSSDLAFSWAKSDSTSYVLEISLDSKFTQIIIQPTVTPVPATLDPVVALAGPYQPAGFVYNFEPGVTYYWRVRGTVPLETPNSAVRSFTFSSLDKPFALVGPAIGTTDVGLNPILSWTAYKGALWYELTLSEYPDFSIPEWSHNVYGLVYGVTKDEALKNGTTYFWRVRGVTATPYVLGTKIITPAGAWEVGAFTTAATPVAPEKEQVVVVQQAPAPPPQIVTVEKEVLVQQPIPNWMLMTIIVIGAVLVIALIVLIVRTRRVA